MSLYRKIKNFIKSWLGVDYGPTIDDLKQRGLTIGENFQDNGCDIDASHCWLITIGNNVTCAPGVYLLAHDASTKRDLGYTKIGRVTIGDDTFLGARSVIMPGVTVGNNCVIGTGSVVTHDIPDGSVAAGNPARVICTKEEYINKNKAAMEELPVFEEDYTLYGGITVEKKEEMKSALKDRKGFVK